MQGRETYMMPWNLHLRTESHKEENEVEMIFIYLESWRHGLQNSAFSRRFWRLGEFSFFSELLWLFLLKLMQCYIVTVEIQWSNRYFTSAHINNKYGNTALWYHNDFSLLFMISVQRRMSQVLIKEGFKYCVVFRLSSTFTNHSGIGRSNTVWWFDFR